VSIFSRKKESGTNANDGKREIPKKNGLDLDPLAKPVIDALANLTLKQLQKSAKCPSHWRFFKDWQDRRIADIPDFTVVGKAQLPLFDGDGQQIFLEETLLIVIEGDISSMPEGLYQKKLEQVEDRIGLGFKGEEKPSIQEKGTSTGGGIECIQDDWKKYPYKKHEKKKRF